MNHPSPERRVGGWLRAGDPAAGEPPLDRAAVRTIRDRMLAAAHPSPTAPPSAPSALWAALALAAALAFAVGLRPVLERPRPEPRGPAPVRPAGGSAREIRFVTPGGTPIVWQLLPAGTHLSERTLP